MSSNSEIILRFNQDLQNLDSRRLQEYLNPKILHFLRSNQIRLYFLESLPKHLEQLQTCVSCINGEYHILLLNSELKLLAGALKIPIKWMANVALVHEIAHIIGDSEDKNHSEKTAWGIGFTLLSATGVDTYTYCRIRDYILGKERR